MTLFLLISDSWPGPILGAWTLTVEITFGFPSKTFCSKPKLPIRFHLLLYSCLLLLASACMLLQISEGYGCRRSRGQRPIIWVRTIALHPIHRQLWPYHWALWSWFLVQSKPNRVYKRATNSCNGHATILIEIDDSRYFKWSMWHLFIKRIGKPTVNVAGLKGNCFLQTICGIFSSAKRYRTALSWYLKQHNLEARGQWGEAVHSHIDGISGWWISCM